MRKLQLLFILLGTHLFLSACGYHFGLGDLPAKYETISVPYVEGDASGELTAQLIKELGCSGALTYSQNGGELILQVKIVEISEMNVGFRYDRNKKDKREHDIIPSETRITAQVEVSVVEAASCCTVLGPAKLQASAEFDHDYYFGSGRTNDFSLGQLTDYDSAFDAVKTPLYYRLSEKIVDYVIHSW